jgi:hypothetical protein
MICAKEWGLNLSKSSLLRKLTNKKKTKTKLKMKKRNKAVRMSKKKKSLPMLLFSSSKWSATERKLS